MKAGTLTLPAKDKAAAAPIAPNPEDRATREKVILALLPVAARHDVLNQPQRVVEIATTLCEYIARGTEVKNFLE